MLPTQVRVNVYSLEKLMSETRRLAVEYRRTTGKPLAVSSEIARYDAARLLSLELVDDPGIGYDAIGTGPRKDLRIQIKGRAILGPGKSGQRIGQLKSHRDWDRLVLVLMDENFEPIEIYEADREAVDECLENNASSRRTRRGALSVARIKIIGRLAWTRENGLEDDGYWENHP